MRVQQTPYPLRMRPELKLEAQELADKEDRSLNWLLNEAVRIGIAQMRSVKENASTAATAKR